MLPQIHFSPLSPRAPSFPYTKELYIQNYPYTQWQMLSRMCIWSDTFVCTLLLMLLMLSVFFFFIFIRSDDLFTMSNQVPRKMAFNQSTHYLYHENRKFPLQWKESLLSSHRARESESTRRRQGGMASWIDFLSFLICRMKNGNMRSLKIWE